jgi:hypothetical protein
MQIVCTTTRAAVQVLHLLLSTGLRPVSDFEIRPFFSIVPPITYTMLAVLTDALWAKIGAVADTSIVG